MIPSSRVSLALRFTGLAGAQSAIPSSRLHSRIGNLTSAARVENPIRDPAEGGIEYL